MDYFTLFYSDSNFFKSPNTEVGKTPNFSGREHFYSCFKNPNENSDFSLDKYIMTISLSLGKYHFLLFLHPVLV